MTMFEKLYDDKKRDIGRIITGASYFDAYDYENCDSKTKESLDYASNVYLSIKSIRKQNYQEYLKSDEWKQTAQQIKERDNHKCRICRATSDLEVHHLTYARIYNEKPYDLVTLCNKCHTMAHKVTEQY